MKTTHLVAVLVAIAALALFAADASAMYHPSLGRWLQRDPGPGGMMAAPRVGTAGPAIGGEFIPRDHTAQYRDGMNLYQYVGGSPTRFADPSGLQALLPLALNLDMECGEFSWPTCCKPTALDAIKGAVSLMNDQLKVAEALKALKGKVKTWKEYGEQVTSGANAGGYRSPSFYGAQSQCIRQVIDDNESLLNLSTITDSISLGARILWNWSDQEGQVRASIDTEIARSERLAGTLMRLAKCIMIKCCAPEPKPGTREWRFRLTVS